MNNAIGTDDNIVRVDCYQTEIIGGTRVARVALFLWKSLGHDGLQAVVSQVVAKLLDDQVAVVLLKAVSINHEPRTTQSFSCRMIQQLALRRVTLGLFNYDTSGYEILFSYHRYWPVGSIGESTVMNLPRQSGNGQAHIARTQSSPRPAAVSLEEASPKLRELNRLVELLGRSQSPTKRQARLAQVARLRQELGIVDVA